MKVFMLFALTLITLQSAAHANKFVSCSIMAINVMGDASPVMSKDKISQSQIITFDILSDEDAALQTTSYVFYIDESPGVRKYDQWELEIRPDNSVQVLGPKLGARAMGIDLRKQEITIQTLGYRYNVTATCEAKL